MWRLAVGAVLLVFAWKGSAIDLSWPPVPSVPVVVPKPGDELLVWAEPLREVLPKMLAKDRRYLCSFYDAMSFVIIRDSKRDEPIIGTTEDFIRFHVGSLRLAIDRQDVGKYDGLAAAIDKTFLNAIGSDSRGLSADDRTKLAAACSTMAYVLKVGGDG